MTTVRLHPRPAVADARRLRGHDVRRPGQSARSALGLSCARWRETPIGQPMVRDGHRGRRCGPVRGLASATAKRSGSRTLPGASCPDSGRVGRTSRAQHPGAPPSSPSRGAIRVFEPWRPGWPRRRRATRARLVRSVTVRAQPAGPADGMCRETRWSPRASWLCRNREPGESTSHHSASGTGPRRTAGSCRRGPTGAIGSHHRSPGGIDDADSQRI